MKSHVVAIGMILSVGAHFGAFTLMPGVRVGTLDVTRREIEAVDLPPEIRVPPPPEAIARPATPRISASPDVSEDVTIAPTTFDHNPVSSLGPPPAARPDSAESERLQFVPYEVAPKLKNGAAVRAMLERLYPGDLRRAGIEGRVVVWIHLDRAGHPDRVRIQDGSGYTKLDEVASEVAMAMEFTPALNRDRPVAVWVAQAVQFSIQ